MFQLDQKVVVAAFEDLPQMTGTVVMVECSWVVWRNRRGYTCNTLKGAKAIAGSLIADAQR